MTAKPSPWPQVAGIVALLTVIVSVLLTAFAWPAVRSSVHDVPIAVAGPAAATGQVTAALNERQPGAFDVVQVAGTAEAEAAIRDREVYGAIDLSGGGPQVLTASAASPVVAQTLQGVANALAHASDPAAAQGGAAAGTVVVRDVVAAPADDPRGAGMAAAALPIVLGGIVAAGLLTLRITGVGRRVAGALGFAVAGALAMAAILQFWLGALSGDYFANAGVLALGTAAISLTILGLESLLGPAGLGIGAATMMLLGNPLAGVSTAPEMLPGWSGAFGQLLPPGAAGSLLRSVAFFDGAGAGSSIVVLSTWLAAGAALCVISVVRARRRATIPAEEPATMVPA
ncbi:ABC transporter permease [Actinoplanes sp. NPDC023714]|uniref:ABC transporter permease n=1 Tax=Actinoplanes sp. NPDC023714 TaxID=3154322 RepID=UPI0033F57E41